uniref:Uncharacterized protein n=1 Tax=Nelumbo nucifera TaxID=4432 RepID=A0A822YD31_NELNU|nr:TPA_asm: hypothetical protein HUJ06_030353 [Nelumbo nucifera]
MLRKLFAGASGTMDQWHMISNRRFSSICSTVDSIVLRSLKEHNLEISKMTPPPVTPSNKLSLLCISQK